MSRNLFLAIIFAVLISDILADSPCGDWLTYRDEKCFKVIDKLVEEKVAGSECEVINGTFASITNKEEQDLVYNYLKKKGFADNVWIGVKKVNNSLKEIGDGSVLNYSNWNTGRPLKQKGLDCIEVAVDYQGKWVDVKCEKKNAVLCEKNQEWTNSKVQNILQELRKTVHQMKQDLVPIGFIYVQFGGQAEPHSLWPSTQWKNITSKYAGLFFRAEGGGSSEFGKVQDEQEQSIEVMDERCEDHCLNNIKNSRNDPHIKIGHEFPQGALWTGNNNDNGYGLGIKFKHNLEEIRPRNQAIRIWIRIQ